MKTEKICRTFFSIQSLSNIAVIGNFDFNNFFNVIKFLCEHLTVSAQIAQVVAL